MPQKKENSKQIYRVKSMLDVFVFNRLFVLLKYYHRSLFHSAKTSIEEEDGLFSEKFEMFVCLMFA